MSANETFIKICGSCSGLNRIKLVAAQKPPQCGHCKADLGIAAGAKPQKFIAEVDFSTMLHVIKNSPVPVIVDFWAPWCGPCLGFAPVYESFSIKYPSAALYLKLNTEDHQEAGGQFNIRGIPTLVMFKDGKEFARQSGAMPMDMLTNWVQKQGIALS